MWRGEKTSAEQAVLKLRADRGADGPGQKRGPGKETEISEPSYYRWRKESGGLPVDQARKMKDLERANTRLRRPVADLFLAKHALADVAARNLYF